MKKIILSFVLALSSVSVYSQSQSNTTIDETTESKSYALLDLGFEAKLLHLSNSNSKPTQKEKVKKSPRSLEDILGKSKKESSLKYHLIAGCFSSISNANHFVASLTEEGYDSRVIGENEHGLHMVTYRTYDSQSEALKALNDLDSQGISSWIRKQ